MGYEDYDANLAFAVLLHHELICKTETGFINLYMEEQNYWEYEYVTMIFDGGNCEVVYHDYLHHMLDTIKLSDFDLIPFEKED